MRLLLLPIIGLFAMCMIHAHAEDSEPYVTVGDTVVKGVGTHVVEGKEIVHKGVNGTFVIEERSTEYTVTIGPRPEKLSECQDETLYYPYFNDYHGGKLIGQEKGAPKLEKIVDAGGAIRWDAKFDQEKVLPDLQKLIDSGSEQLCVTIVTDFDMYGKAHHVKPANNIEDLLTHHANEGVRFEDRGFPFIRAVIPTSLVDELVKNDNVANIDLYGKIVMMPFHVFKEFPYKIGSVLQQEILTQKKRCEYTVDLAECPPLDKNADGKYVVDVNMMLTSISRDNTLFLTKEQKYDRMMENSNLYKMNNQKMIEFLESNNQNVRDLGHPYDSFMLPITVDVDFIPQLVALDNVWMLNAANITIYLTKHDSNSNDRSLDHSSYIANLKAYLAKDEITTIFDEQHGYVKKNPPPNMTEPIDAVPILDGSYDANSTGLPISTSESEKRSEMPQDYTQTLILSPYRQAENGIPHDEIQCKGDMIPVMLKDRIVCLGESSIKILHSRGILN